jgi:ABC-type Fe3+ transport system substrate-binding protein
MARVALRLVATLLLVAGLSACAPRTGGAPPPQAQPPQPSTATSDSDRIWQELAAAARAEGKVVVASNNAGVRQTVAEAFKQRFGVEVEIITGRGSDTVARIMRERGAGVSTVDVLISGMGTASSELYPAKALVSIKSLLVVPEVTDLTKWRDGRIRFADPDGEYILRSMESIQNNIVINTDFVSRAELRRSDDLLNPKFQGKIATQDPLAQGGGDGTAGYFLKVKGEEFLKRLYVDQKPVASRDDRQMADWMARGVYPINLTMTEEDVLELMREGFKIEAFSFDDIPPQIGAGGSFLMVLDPAPHPNAAKLWVNWYASREGQELATLALGQPSNRTDVEANAKLPAFLIPQPGREYFDLNDWTFVTVEERPLRARMRALLGG